MKYLYLSLPLVLFILSCSNSKNDTNRQDYASRFEKSVILAPEEQDSITVGRIVAMTTGSNSDLYVLDIGLMQVLKFDEDGSATRVLKLSEGRGPGEFLTPIDIAVDSLDNVYILGRPNSKIAIFNPKGEILEEVVLENRPANIIVDKNQNIFAVAAPYSHNGSLIQKFAKKDGQRYRSVQRFGKRPRKEDMHIFMGVGTSIYLNQSREGNLFLSLYYPYEVRKYTQNGDLLATMTRPDASYSKPELTSEGDIEVKGGNWGILPLKDDVLISQVLEVEPEDDWNLSFDFFQNETFRATVADTTLGIPDIAQFIVSDKYNTVYAGSNSPRPQIVKLVYE